MVALRAVTVIAITTWAAPSNPESDWAAPIPPITGLTLAFGLQGRKQPRMNAGWVRTETACHRAYVVPAVVRSHVSVPGGRTISSCPVIRRPAVLNPDFVIVRPTLWFSCRDFLDPCINNSRQIAKGLKINEGF